MVYTIQASRQTAGVPVPDDLFHMGDVVRKLRERQGLTQQELGDKSGTSVSAVKTLENQPHRSSRQTIAAIAGALGLREVDLIAYGADLDRPVAKGHVRRVARR